MTAELASGIEQINQAITQMDEVTQQNAALVEEAAAAAESLQDQAANLSQPVSVFKTSGEKSLLPVVTKQSQRATEKTVLAQRVKQYLPARQARSARAMAAAAGGLAEASTGGGDWKEF